MRPHPRIRKVVKWGGLVLGILIACAWWVSIVRTAYCMDTRGRGVSLGYGQVELSSNSSMRNYTKRIGITTPHYDMKPADWWFSATSHQYGWSVDVPLWALFAPVALVTALAWRLDILARRREKMNLCPTCHYSLTGLAPGSPCPECGKRAATQS